MRDTQRKALIVLLIGCGTAIGAVRPELIYTKTIGGSGADVGRAVATDAAGNVYVAGTTTSPDFPVVNAYQKRIGGTPLRASTDGGQTWSAPAISDPVYAVAGTAKEPATVYAGTSQAIYKSIDGGKTWTMLPGVNGVVINGLWVDPQTPAIVHAATDHGMLRSVDAGATWQAAATERNYALSLAASAARPAQLFAAINTTTASIYRSTDSGATWSSLKTSPGGAFSLASDDANPDVVYAATAQLGFSAGGATAIYRSQDSGDTWTKVSDAVLTRSTFTLAAAGGAVFAGTTTSLIRSADSGVTWTAVFDSPGNAVAADPAQPKSVYADTAAGIVASTDGGLTWKPVLPIRQFVETLAVAPTSPSTVFVGSTYARNAFVTKMTADGKQTFYSTYLGGSYLDSASGIAVDRQGNAYIAGYTYSTDFPVTSGAVQAKNASNTYTPFLAKLGPNGDTLAYSTYLGGSGQDAAFAIALDSAANAYVTGYASSGDFPTTPGALATKLRPNDKCAGGTPADAFVAKIDTAAGTLRYATLLGGGCLDQTLGIAVDGAGSAYVAGFTNSPDFPITTGAAQTKPGDSFSGFAAKLSPQGDSLVYSTFVGGPKLAAAFDIAVDAKGAAYVTGDSASGGAIPVISGTPPGILQSSVGLSVSLGGAAFVAKIDGNGATFPYVKYLGNGGGNGYSIALDAQGRAWVGGATRYSGPFALFPTLHAFQAKGGTGFLTQLDADGSLLFSSMAEMTPFVTVDDAGNAFAIASTLRVGKGTLTSATLTRIDTAVSRAVTAEEPMRIAPPNWYYAEAGVAAGEILAVAGSGLGPSQGVAAQMGSDGKLATSLGGTKVTFDGVAAPLLSVQADKVVFIAPFALADSSLTTMRVETAAGTSNAILMPTVYSNLEALTAVNSDGTINSQNHPAAPGSVVTIYGAGFGMTIPDSQDGRVNVAGSALLQAPLGVTVGDQSAKVLYSGPAPGQVAGISQINFTVPQLAAGSYPTVIGWSPVKNYDYDQITIWVGP